MKTSILLSALVLFPMAILVQRSKDAAPPQKESAREEIRNASDPDTHSGYSIFRETLVDLTWPEVKKAAESDAVVLVPLAVIEEHGPHLSLGADAYLAYQRCKMLKQKLASRQIPVVVTPPVYWGIMQLTETGAYPGSFTVRPSTMKALLMDIFTDLRRWGFRRVYCLNQHGDRVHRQTLREALIEAKDSLGLVFYNEQERADEEHRPDIREYVAATAFRPDFHSGAWETAAMLEYFPEEVNTALAKSLKPENTFHPLGYVGDPANHAYVNIRAIDSVEVNFTANCIATWAEKTNRK